MRLIRVVVRAALEGNHVNDGSLWVSLDPVRLRHIPATLQSQRSAGESGRRAITLPFCRSHRSAAPLKRRAT